MSALITALTNMLVVEQGPRNRQVSAEVSERGEKKGRPRRGRARKRGRKGGEIDSNKNETS